MHNFFEFSALISAFSWAISGAILKTIKIKNVLSFPFYEAIFSLFLLSVFVTFFYSWSSVFSQNFNSLILFAIGRGIGCVGFIIYVGAIKKISIGIVFTVSASCNLLMISLLDYFLNSIIYNWLVLFGASLVLISIFILNFEFISKSKQFAENFRGIFYGIIAGLLWGVATYLNDLALEEARFIDAALVRTIVWVILPAMITLIIRKKFDFIFNNKPYLIKIIFAAILATSSTLLWFISLNYTTGSLSVIFGNTSPIFALIIGYLFLKEKISIYQLFAIFVSLVGISLVIIFR